MAAIDLNAVIRDLVVAEIEQTLEPYRNVLDRLGNLMGAAPAAAPAAPRAARRPARRGRGRGRAAAAEGKGDASTFGIGQTVRYRQGRGLFEATVSKIDVAAGVLTLQRKSDGKVVSRPASKVIAS